MATNNSINSQDPIQVALGGTGAATLTAHGVLVGEGTSAVTPLSAGTSGQVLVGSTGADPVFATLTSSDSSITFTTGAGTLSLQVTTPVSPWTDVTGTSVALAANNAYILDNAGLVTATLPATAAVGNTFTIVGKGTGGWKVAQNASQLIHFGVSTTTTGAGGSLASSNTFDCVKIVCTVTNTTFTVYDCIGNITVV